MKIQRSIIPLQEEIVIPGLNEDSLYAKWESCIVSPQPIQSQIDFYKDNVDEITSDLNQYYYWYDKIETLHPSVQDEVRKFSEFEFIGNSVGSLYYFRKTESVVPISEYISTNIPVVNAINYGKLNSQIYLNIANANNNVNDQARQNYAKFLQNSTESPFESHCDVLVKDIEHSARIAAVKPKILNELKNKFSILLDMTNVEKHLRGNIAIIDNIYPYQQNHNLITLDSFKNKIELDQGWMTIWKLKPEDME